MNNNDAQEPELLPCPFCGSADIEMWDGLGTQAEIVCTECGCGRSEQVSFLYCGEPWPDFSEETGRYPEEAVARAKKHLIEKWNTRYGVKRI
jgi:transcription initiation factor TFIIIB Brf1 subunit/transcription initiation factor TFIIB